LAADVGRIGDADEGKEGSATGASSHRKVRRKDNAEAQLGCNCHFSVVLTRGFLFREPALVCITRYRCTPKEVATKRGRHSDG